MGRKKSSVDIKAIAGEIFDEILAGRTSPDVLQNIGEEELGLLRRIKSAALKVSEKMPHTLEYRVAPDHDNFEFFTIDAATVHLALLDLSCHEFFAPLMGGRKYLEHVLQCEYCLSFVGEGCVAVDPDIHEEICKIASEFFGIAHSAGIDIVPGARTVRRALKLPEKN